MEQVIKLLEYFPFSSSVNPSFWYKLTEIKLDVDKLNENGRNIWGYYSNLTFNTSTTVPFEIDSTSFNVEYTNQNIYLPANGVLLNKNTIGQFKDCDKTELIQHEGRKIWNYIKNGEAAENPSLLNYFFVLSFADLKKYHYYYWFCFPTLAKINVKLIKAVEVGEVFDNAKLEKLCKSYQEMRTEQKPFFLVKNETGGFKILPLKSTKEFENSTDLNEYFYAFSDPSTSAEYPGWPIRNFILFLLHNCPLLSGNSINVFAFRLNRQGNEVHCKKSIIFTVTLPSIDFNDIINTKNSWIGWERNERCKFGPRLSNMKASIDPKCLAETAVDLNLKLMKWQLLPNINLEKIKNAKCLLLGSGTLGCSVSRILLGWGVRNISFVDNAQVSFSNPVRQSLFTYEDCTKNKPKAEAAAENLRKIFPGVNTKGYNLSISMPGHPIGESLLAQTEQNVKILTNLISDHDIIFLLMDSRESRWLPTLLGAYYKKIVINAALGFDTYLIMRHGFKCSDISEEIPGSSTQGLKAIPGNELGCYFCNDVTAPGNSLKDRTLDQQCTVSRPGISAIAGALAVELAVSILQHPKGAKAAAFYKSSNCEMGDSNNPDESILGILPHSIRGFLSSFNQMLPATAKYKQCVACSDIVLKEYEMHGFEFLLKVFESCKYLENVTGLSEIHNEIADLEIWDLDTEESE